MYNFKRFEKYSAILEKVVDFFFPRGTYCLCCGNFINHESEYCLCEHCREHIRWGRVKIDLKANADKMKKPSFLDGAYAAMSYGPYERRLVFTLKYNKNTFASRVIAKIMFDRVQNDKVLRERLKGVDFILPVPLSLEKEEKRGFNQAEKIGRHLGDALGLSCVDNVLLRNKETTEQKATKGEDRYENVEGAFSVNEKYKVALQGKSVLLLDDVFTTGATANTCAKALKECGVREVILLVLASGNDFAEGFFK